MLKRMTPAQIDTRLAEIATELAELEKIDHDALLTKAVVNGEDVDQAEENQAQAERRARRLRIEREALSGMVPEAKRIEAAPAIDKMKKAHSAKIAESAKVVAEALRHWGALQAAIAQLQTLRAEANNLTIQAQGVAREAGSVDPISVMGLPVSRKLQQAGEYMTYAGREMCVWASMGMRDGDNGYHGLNVDPVDAEQHGLVVDAA